MATDDYSVVAIYIQDLLEQNKTNLGLQDIFYGDQQLIPRNPTVCVESGPYQRELSGMTNRTDISMEIFILVYFSKVQDEQMTRLQCDQMAVQIMEVLHSDRSMGGNVIHGFVTAIEPGYAVRGGKLMRASRLTWSGFSKLALP